jgi:hypothetical protein
LDKPPLPPFPRWVAPAGLGVWLGLTALAARMEQWSDTFPTHFIQGVVQSVAGVALALGGIGEVLRWWQHQKWRRLTQWIAFDLLDQAIRETSAIARRAVYVLAGPATHDDHRISQIDHVFKLPWSPVRDDVVREVKIALGPHVRALFSGHRPDERTVSDGSSPDTLHADVIKRASALGPDLERPADKLRHLALELGAYVDERDAIELLTAVAQLHERVRELAALSVGAPAESLASHAGIKVDLVLTTSTEVTKRLSVSYSKLRLLTSDENLDDKLARDEQHIKLETTTMKEMLNDWHLLDKLRGDDARPEDS